MEEFDTCKPGSSALFAALVRNTEAEIAHWLNLKVGGLFHDFHKFFDTLNVSILLSEAIHTRYPPIEMAMAIQQHTAPRIIKLCNFIGKPNIVHNSIIAGCGQSVAMTRAYMKRGMSDVNKSEIMLDDSVFNDVLEPPMF